MVSRHQNREERTRQILRSRHYTRIAEGLAGATPNVALLEILTDIVQICDHRGISFAGLIHESRERISKEKSAAARESKSVA